jgi:hypothetical protein
MSREVTTEQLAVMTDIDILTVRKVLKCMSIIIAAETLRGNEVDIEFLGKFGKKSRYWSFNESDYLNTIRNSRVTAKEFVNLLLTEDDQLQNKHSGVV